MDSLLASTLLKLAIPVGFGALALFLSAKRGMSLRDDIGFCRPRALAIVGWIGFWLVWIVASEWIINNFGLEQAKPWPNYPFLILAIRVVAIGLAGPLAEELVMRGVIFFRLRKTSLGPYGAILVTAIFWAAMHYSYGIETLALVALDGVILGLARYKSGSLWIPIAMHVIGNLISIAQSLSM